MKLPKRKRITKSRGLDRRFAVVLIAVSAPLIALAMYAAFLITSRGEPATAAAGPAPAVRAEPSAGKIRLPLTQLTGGKAGFFKFYTGDGREVRFVAVERPDHQYTVALDACEPCHGSRAGHRQVGQDIVCNDCGKRFAAATLGQTSDPCTPVSLPHVVEAGHLVIRPADLERGSRYFPPK